MIENIEKRNNILLDIEQNTAYELTILHNVNESIETIEIVDDTAVQHKVRYAISYTFDNKTWSPYTTDFIKAIQKIHTFAKTLNEYAVIRIKVICDFDDEHDYVRLHDIKINDTAIAHNRITITELQYYRGITNQYTKNLFKPYSNLAVSVDRMLAQSFQISNIFGHDVYYIKVDEIDESLNSTFKEFEKYKVQSIKKLKIVIPDNDFKANRLIYSEFNIEYEEDLEAHIVIEEFERAFGVGERPEAKDIVYIPQIGRMYDITSSQHELQLNNTASFNVCTLKRHVTATDIDYTLAENSEFDINKAVNFDINDFENSMSTDNSNTTINNDTLDKIDYDNTIKTDKVISNANVEGVDSQKLHLYHYLTKHDAIRKYVHKSAQVINSQLSINNVPIFYRQYNLLDCSDIAIEYNSRKIFNHKSFCLSLWLKLNNADTDILMFDKFKLSKESNRLSIFVDNERISYIDIKNIDDWHFVSININNDINELTWQIFNYNVATSEFNLVREEFVNVEMFSDFKFNSKLLIFSKFICSNIKLYAKNIVADDIISLALDKSFSIEDSIIVDTVFDIKT